MLAITPNNPELVRYIKDSSYKLKNELALQKVLSSGNASDHKPNIKVNSLVGLISDIEKTFQHTPIAKESEVIYPNESLSIKTDFYIASKVLLNMLLNAIEASKHGDAIRLETEISEEWVKIMITNTAFIADKYVNRIFQRNFSTKSNLGRGLCTYSMKFFTEKILKGKVYFTTSKDTRTTFTLEIKNTQ